MQLQSTGFSGLPITLDRFHRDSARRTDEQTMSTLRDLLKRNHANHIVYRGFLANHMVHVLYTQWQLGADANILQHSFDVNSAELNPLPAPKIVITQSTWQNHLGDNDLYSEYLAFFEQELVTDSFDTVFHRFFPTLIPGLMGALTHPWIHIAFAVEFNDSLVLAEGLAYACTYYAPIDLSPTEDASTTPAGQFSDPLDILRAVQDDPSVKVDDNASPFSKRLNQYLQPDVLHRVNKLVNGWPLVPQEEDPQATLSRLTIAIVVLYASRANDYGPDFFQAHAVTSLLATHILLPYLSPADQVLLLRLQLHVAVMTYVTEGKGSLSVEKVKEYAKSTPRYAALCHTELDAQINETVLKSDDEHLGKVVRALDYFRRVHGEQDQLFLGARCKTVDSIGSVDDWQYRKGSS
ncbi:hypothetical protein H4R33_005975 [Dimargaris cristalligena]|uniref:Uncharacterized protein n=1 Tax=Dimargaris cristalligena TaxID=215637 RepID=A0A4P9ZS71_9FUNG|nr:hypothetical protein H4R33_005975 [Dimargaris cristalligena]RKP35532.1 hypothetical protein BJ085DRAFT_35977 [Dimargaris cristalligena]|eukprot:RKP35532.1 hypothetical protein BJ085DRAFT_35977 [Dimargaris cristalligena]